MRLFGVFGSNRAERELSAEIESHLQLHIDDNLRAGMTPQEARRRALHRARRRGRDEGGVSRSPRPAGVRIARPRCALRRPDAAQDAGLRAGRRRDSRPRHRRQLRHLHRGQRGGAEAAAVRGAGSHHAAVADAAAVAVQARRPSRCRRPTSSTGKRRTRSFERMAIYRGRPADAHRSGRARRGDVPARVGGLPADSRPLADARPRLHARTTTAPARP